MIKLVFHNIYFKSIDKAVKDFETDNRWNEVGNNLKITTQCLINQMVYCCITGNL